MKVVADAGPLMALVRRVWEQLQKRK